MHLRSGATESMPYIIFFSYFVRVLTASLLSLQTDVFLVILLGPSASAIHEASKAASSSPEQICQRLGSYFYLPDLHPCARCPAAFSYAFIPHKQETHINLHKRDWEKNDPLVFCVQSYKILSHIQLRWTLTSADCPHKLHVLSAVAHKQVSPLLWKADQGQRKATCSTSGPTFWCLFLIFRAAAGWLFIVENWKLHI